METREYNVYKFDELSETGKQQALTKLYDINVDHDWWSFIYEDATRVGLKLTEFDAERGNFCRGNFISSASECANLLLTNHGEGCTTFKTATEFLAARDALVDSAPRDENGGFESEHSLDAALDTLEADFLNSLLEDYLLMLRKEYEYLTSEEAIAETIRANDYDLTEAGDLD